MARYYRAGIIPTKDFTYDMVWLDYPAHDMTDAENIADDFVAEHGFVQWVVIKELSPKHGREYPRSEPARYGREKCPRHPESLHIHPPPYLAD